MTKYYIVADIEASPIEALEGEMESYGGSGFYDTKEGARQVGEDNYPDGWQVVEVTITGGWEYHPQVVELRTYPPIGHSAQALTAHHQPDITLT